MVTFEIIKKKRFENQTLGLHSTNSEFTASKASKKMSTTTGDSGVPKDSYFTITTEENNSINK